MWREHRSERSGGEARHRVERGQRGVRTRTLPGDNRMLWPIEPIAPACWCFFVLLPFPDHHLSISERRAKRLVFVLQLHSGCETQNARLARGAGGAFESLVG